MKFESKVEREWLLELSVIRFSVAKYRAFHSMRIDEDGLTADNDLLDRYHQASVDLVSAGRLLSLNPDNPQAWLPIVVSGIRRTRHKYPQSGSILVDGQERLFSETNKEAQKIQTELFHESAASNQSFDDLLMNAVTK